MPPFGTFAHPPYQASTLYSYQGPALFCANHSSPSSRTVLSHLDHRAAGSHDTRTQLRPGDSGASIAPAASTMHVPSYAPSHKVVICTLLAVSLMLTSCEKATKTMLNDCQYESTSVSPPDVLSSPPSISSTPRECIPSVHRAHGCCCKSRAESPRPPH